MLSETSRNAVSAGSSRETNPQNDSNAKETGHSQAQTQHDESQASRRSSSVVTSSGPVKSVSGQKSNRSDVPLKTSKSGKQSEPAESASAITCDASQQLPVALPTNPAEETPVTSQTVLSAGNDGDRIGGAADQLAGSVANNLQEKLAQAGFELNAPGMPLTSDSSIDSETLHVATDPQAVAGAESPNTASAEIAISANPESTGSFDPGAIQQNSVAAKDFVSKVKFGKTSNTSPASTESGKNSGATSTDDKRDNQHDASSTQSLHISERSLQQQLNGDSQANSSGAQTSNGNTSQNISFVAHVANAQGSSSDHSAHKADDSALQTQPSAYPVPEEVNAGGLAGAQGLNTAKLIQSMSETEMRVGMHSQDFGDISIRTSVSHQQMQAQISVDHNELGKVISAHLPAVQTKLGEDFGLHATIEVNQAAGFLAGRDGGSSQQNSGAPAYAHSTSKLTAMSDAEPIATLPMQLVAIDGRLDIRA
jgi:hypothetical protein